MLNRKRSHEDYNINYIKHSSPRTPLSAREEYRTHKRSREQTASPRRTKQSVRQTWRFSTPISQVGALPKTSIRTTYGASSPLSPYSKNFRSGMAGSNRIPSEDSNLLSITSNSPEACFVAEHSTPQKDRSLKISSSNGRPSIYQRPGALDIYQQDAGSEIVLGVTPYPSPRDTTGNIPTCSFQQALFGFGRLNLHDSVEHPEPMSRSTSARTALSIQTPPSSTSFQSPIIWDNITSRQNAPALSPLPSGPTCKRIKYSQDQADCPVVNQYQENDRFDRFRNMMKQLSESDSESDVEIVMEDPNQHNEEMKTETTLYQI
ncbi:uncharacterized protein L203_103046 [Cryptococcus depauperatus CBS 7841]|uniref:Uncharacterized protein n=1 Tax=Cryptococcus depauperatus CBS 7841 TaxID=1295531 RepID=A0A1E3IPN6_9TREE|nr:hypothetical protein L203_01680 [Cryptococcus depauperatus CBS 7841]